MTSPAPSVRTLPGCSSTLWLLLALLIAPGAAAVPPAPSQPQASCAAVVGGKCYVNGAFTLSSFSAGAHHYQVCRSEDTTGWGGCQVVMTTNSGSTFVVSGTDLPTHGYRRAYRFRACDAAGACTLWSASSEAYVYMDAQGPAAPSPTAAPCLYQSAGCWVTGDFTISTVAPTDVGSGVNPSGYHVCRSHDSTGGHAGCNQFLTTHGGTGYLISGSNLPADGYRRAYYFKATDQVGNLGAWNSPVYVRVDRHPPTVSADNASQSWFPSRSVTVSAADATGGTAANSGLAAVRYTWNLPLKGLCSGTLTSPGAILTVPEGDNTLYLCAMDNTGRATQWSGGPYRVDSVPPSQPGPPTTTCLHDDGGCWVTGDFTLSFAASTDAGSGVVANGYRICRSEDSEGGHAGCQRNMTLAAGTSYPVTGADLPSDGFRRAYWLRAQDIAGNWSAWSAPLYVRVDRHAPTVSADNASSDWFPSRTLTVTADDAVGGAAANSGLAEVRYQWNVPLKLLGCGGTLTAPGAALDVPDGDNTLYLCAKDHTGRVTQWSGGPYRVDGTPPSLDGLTVSSGAWTINDRSTYGITAQVSDTGRGLREIRMLINYQGSNSAHRRGFFSWRETPASYQWSADQVPCIGGGFASKHPTDFNPGTIRLVGCTTSFAGRQRTVTFTVEPNETFGEFGAINDVSLWARDLELNATGWTSYDVNFSTAQLAPVDAALLTAVELPTAVDCGATFNASVALENSGNTVWRNDATASYRLGTVDGTDPFGLDAYLASQPLVSVPPGDSHRFDLVLTAPDLPRNSPMGWRMIHDGLGAFGDEVIDRVNVVCQLSETNGAELVAHTLPAVMPCGSTRTATVEMRNTGTSIWRRDHLFRLAVLGGSDPLTPQTRVLLPADVQIANGQSHTFEIALTAPATAGVVTTDWRMVHERRALFGDVAAQDVIVDCSTFGVRFGAEAVANGGSFGLGPIPESQTPLPVSFTITPPNTPGQTVSNLRVVSVEGPVTFQLTDPGPGDVPVGLGLVVNGSLAVDSSKALAEQNPFRLVVAFDTSFGESFQFEVVGDLLHVDSAEVSDWEVSVDGYSEAFGFDLTITADNPVDRHTFFGRIHNGDSNEILRIPVDNLFREEITLPPGVRSILQFAASDPSALEVPPLGEVTFQIVLEFEPDAAGGPVELIIHVIPSNSPFAEAFDFYGNIEIERDVFTLDDFQVRFLDTNETIGPEGGFVLDPVGEEPPVLDFELFHGRTRPARVVDVATVETTQRGVRLNLFPSSGTVDPGLGFLFGGQLEILPHATPGDFEIEVLLVLDDEDLVTPFQDVFRFYVQGLLTVCGDSEAECGPVLEIHDDLGRLVTGSYSRRVEADKVHLLHYEITNAGDVDLQLIPSVVLNGDARFRVSQDYSATVLPAGSTNTSLFVLEFDGTGTALGDRFTTEVILNSNAANSPYSFDLTVEAKRPNPLIVELGSIVAVDDRVDLGLSDTLPLTPVLRITNPTDETYWIKGFRPLKVQGGPLEWTWAGTLPPIGFDTDDAKEVPKNEERPFHAQPVIRLDDVAGDPNGPYAFNLIFEYSTDRDSETRYSEYTLRVEGELEEIFNPIVDVPPDVDCSDPVDDCVAAFCTDVDQIFDEARVDGRLCVASALGTLLSCYPCGPKLPCWGLCLFALVQDLGCPVAVLDVADQLSQAVLDTKDCHCTIQGTFCQEEFFLGYEVTGIPLGAVVELEGRCLTTGGHSVRNTRSISYGSAEVEFDFLRCPKDSFYSLETGLVQVIPGGTQYECRAVGADAAHPNRLEGILDQQFQGTFDCSCPDPNGCGQYYVLFGTAEGLNEEDKDAVDVVINLHGLPQPTALQATVTANGPFQLYGALAPAVDSYSVAVTNKAQYPHCSVEATAKNISGDITNFFVMRLVCDKTQPNVTITSPRNEEKLEADLVTGTIPVRAVAGDATGIRKVSFFADGELIGETTLAHEVQWAPIDPGQYVLVAEAESVSNGTASSEPVSVTVSTTSFCATDTAPPVVELVSPSGGVVEVAFGGTLLLQATVSDDQGTSQVDFYLNGVKRSTIGSGPTYMVSVDEVHVPVGSNTLHLEVFDRCSKSTVTSELTFTVEKQQPDLAGGSVTQVDCDMLAGRAVDPSHTSKVQVEIYQGGPRGVGNLLWTVLADESCSSSPEILAPERCFSVATLAELKTGSQESVHFFAEDIDSLGQPTGLWQELVDSPQTLICPP